MTVSHSSRRPPSTPRPAVNARPEEPKGVSNLARTRPRRRKIRRVDDVDRKILAVLRKEGRLTVTELAERVRLSVSPCHRRLRALAALVGLGSGPTVTVRPSNRPASTTP